ncbi:ABC transporter ATP-binding protein [Acidipropionibacterium jensenii]|uniref:ABC transporter ATP-binding protein n=1 Tax=Acidipropionibacterium jensenii TaxID=1749 RepID=UPI00110A73FD|nr:ABC transporter ATP-binding protein [Acidipropionibacterium jensenii]MDN5977914.1 ABC transporter ATP-binding protein [Acidipropionibacterium jensenii]MDN5996689.1 ABC transporter ATP-binding protein [Acidipropionibacterium jensenii]MDN6425960.1 ABC transporter ATP-binding protein [Acidipropionibacterium jensenii]MDN6441622.1 ABC transporter ATP-binding protein [Acidipropionibacterium jensenii]MDN6480825.1 ABC transporter ATP-binding protein [Acidipropionibacterium jensenii]
MTAPAARAAALTKTYGRGDTLVVALDSVDVSFEQGHFTSVMGPSGSGKSTLMHCMAALDRPTSGQAFIGETDVATLSDNGLTELRRDRIGFIFQSFNLVPTLTAKENILLPLAIAGRRPDPHWWDEVIETVGLANRLSHKPSELSGGQQQRVACARALVSQPEIIFADEPTGNLDSTSSGEVLDFLRSSVETMGQTIVMVSHDPVAASFADRALFLADGRIVDDLADPTREHVLDTMARLDERTPAAPRPARRPRRPVAARPVAPTSGSGVSGVAELTN